MNCRECNHEACPHCYGRTTPGPGFAEWEAELLKIGKDGIHIRYLFVLLCGSSLGFIFVSDVLVVDGMFRIAMIISLGITHYHEDGKRVLEVPGHPQTPGSMVSNSCHLL